MIELYTWKTPNGRKASVMLEEIGAAYTVHPVDTHADEQFAPSFAALSPNHKIPVIVDHAPAGGGAPVTLFESGAILHYLARKAGRLLGTGPAGEARALAWSFFQASYIGPNLGSLHHFLSFAEERSDIAIARFVGESERALKVVETRLGQSAFLAGTDYTIADIMTYPWLATVWPVMAQSDDKLSHKYPAIERWLDEIGARPAVKRGMAVPFEDMSVPMGRGRSAGPG